MACDVSRRRRELRATRYWHAGWSGSRIGELLIPLSQQQSRYAEVARIWDQQHRDAATGPEAADDQIYDISKLYVTSDRDFAHAWAVCVPEPDKLEPLRLLYGLHGRANYEVELVDASGGPLRALPGPDPDYAVRCLSTWLG
jgi:hypothetical protein